MGIPITLMDFIVQQSALPVGNTVRDHIENPAVGGGENLVVKDLEGTVIIPLGLMGDILPVEITGVVTETTNIVGIVDENEVEGIIEPEEIGGTVNEC